MTDTNHLKTGVDGSTELAFEALDRGDATPAPPEIKTDAELSLEKQQLVEANFAIAEKTRQDAITAEAINQQEADEFQILKITPKGGDIKKEYEEVTQKIKSGGATTEIEALKQRQAELVIEYSYNTVALLRWYYAKKATQIVQAASQQVEGVTAATKTQVENDLMKKFGDLKQMASDLEIFQKSVDYLVPRFKNQKVNIIGLCQTRNDNMMTFLRQPNHLSSKEDEVVQELGRFVDELRKTLSLDNIDETRQALQKRIDQQTITADATPTPDTEMKPDKPTKLEEGLGIAKSPTQDTSAATGLDGAAPQEYWLPGD